MQKNIKQYFIAHLLALNSFTIFAQKKKKVTTADAVIINSKLLKDERTVRVYSPGNKK